MFILASSFAAYLSAILLVEYEMIFDVNVKFNLIFEINFWNAIKNVNYKYIKNSLQTGFNFQTNIALISALFQPELTCTTLRHHIKK